MTRVYSVCRESLLSECGRYHRNYARCRSDRARSAAGYALPDRRVPRALPIHACGISPFVLSIPRSGWIYPAASAAIHDGMAHGRLENTSVHI